jgi:hypothetical protein
VMLYFAVEMGISPMTVETVEIAKRGRERLDSVSWIPVLVSAATDVTDRGAGGVQVCNCWAC